MRNFVIIIMTGVSLFAGTPSSVPALSDTTNVNVGIVAAAFAKDGVTDLADIEKSGKRILDYELTDHRTDVKLQRYWSLIIMRTSYRLEQETRLKGVSVDAYITDRQIQNALKMKGAIR